MGVDDKIILPAPAQGAVTIGRTTRNTVVLSDARVSVQHCVLSLRPRAMVVAPGCLSPTATDGGGGGGGSNGGGGGGGGGGNRGGGDQQQQQQQYPLEVVVEDTSANGTFVLRASTVAAAEAKAAAAAAAAAGGGGGAAAAAAAAAAKGKRQQPPPSLEEQHLPVERLCRESTSLANGDAVFVVHEVQTGSMLGFRVVVEPATFSWEVVAVGRLASVVAQLNHSFSDTARAYVREWTVPMLREGQGRQQQAHVSERCGRVRVIVVSE
jgi:hypothetical protein